MTASDSVLSDTAVITVNLTDVNEAPVATGATAANLADSSLVTVNITDVNEAPVATGATATNLAEGSTVGTAIHTVAVVDQDAGAAITYSITGGNTGTAFTINSTSGAITVANASALDFETLSTYGLTVTASDSALSDTAVITVSLNDVNEAPIATDATATNLAEGSTAGNAVHTVAASDQDAGASITYSITGGNTGTAFTINTDVNEAPIATGAIAADIAEGSTVGNAVHTVAASDQDAGASITYSITGGNTGTAFTINSTSGAITVASASALDFETLSTYGLTVTASDSVLSDTAVITVSLNDVNETPSITGDTASIIENSPNDSLVHLLVASDPDAGDDLTYSIIGGNTGGTFAIDSDTGQITAPDQLKLNHEAPPSVYGLTVQATDSAALSATAVITVSVTDDPNEPPIAGDQGFSLGEDATLNAVVGTVAALEEDGDIVTYAITGGNTGTAFAINSASGQITVATPSVLDFEGAFSAYGLTVVVNDDDGSDSAIVTISLTDVNEAPIATDATATNLAEGSTAGNAVHTVVASDQDTSDVLTYSITGGNTGTAFTINSTSGAITVADASALDFETLSTYGLTVTASDSVLSDTAVITVNLTDVNEAPVATGATAANLAEGSTAGNAVHTVAASDQDAGAVLTYSITGGNTGTAFTINSTSGAITVAERECARL